jgi:hypothetical protein
MSIDFAVRWLGVLDERNLNFQISMGLRMEDHTGESQ